MDTEDTQQYEKWKAQFPLCFETQGCCMEYGLQCNNGWFPLLERLLTKIESHLAEKYAAGFRDTDYPFKIDQIKEKFGTLRFYVGGADDTIFQWIDSAEEESGRTCEITGASGALCCKRGAFWLRTLCPELAKSHGYDLYDSEVESETSE